MLLHLLLYKFKKYMQIDIKIQNNHILYLEAYNLNIMKLV